MSANPPGPRLACSTASAFTLPLRAIFELLAETGFQGVEVMVTKDPATQDPETIGELAEGFGLRIDAIHAPFLLVTRGVWGTEPVGKIRRAVALAEEVGAPLVVVHPPYRWQGAYRRWMLEELPALARTTSVRVAVENMFPVRVRGRRIAALHTVRDLADLDPFPNVVLDTSHAAVAGLDLLEAVARLGRRIAHVHLSNNAGKGWDSHSPLDEGVLDLAPFLDALAAGGFDGAISLELDLRAAASDTSPMRHVLERDRRSCEAWLARRP
jgi:sugar phosphate isomerase/epimerase